MNRRILTLLALGAAAAFALAMPLSAAPKDTNHNTSSSSGQTAEETETAPCTGGELTVYAPSKLWPPNHKYYTEIYVLAVDETEDENPETTDGPVEVVSTGYHDQYDSETHEELNGSGTPNETPGDDITVNDDEETISAVAGTNADGNPQMVATEDGTGTVQTFWKARAERSGQDPTGRTYTLKATATWSDGTSCAHTVEFTVPHDMRPSRR